MMIIVLLIFKYSRYRQMQNLKSYSGTQQTIKTSLAYRYEPKRQNFNFLLQSIDRQKYNSNCDKENQQHNQGRLSIKIKPNKLDKQSISSNLTKSTFIGLNRSIQRQRSGEKNNQDTLIQNLMYKVKKYLALTQPLIQKDNKQDRAKKQAVNTACEIIQALTALQQASLSRKKKQQSMNSSLNSTGNLVLGSNKSMSSSFHFPNSCSQDSTNFLKKIENLQQQKMQLENIISQHERANIKMFIQLNEGESQQIQSYKKQLSSLFQKYKQLQKLVRKQCQKSKNLQMIIDQFKVSNNHFQKNEYLNKISHFQVVINQQNHYLAKALQQIEYLKQQLSRYRVMEIQYNRFVEQAKRDRHKQLSKFSCQAKIDNQKSTFNSQFSHESTKNSQITQDSSPFSNITLKPNIGADQNLLRMLFTQATMIDQILTK